MSGRVSPEVCLLQLGGVPFYENVPADAPDPSHQYYCPICMLYYGEVYKTHCCMNYMCQECSVVYVSGEPSDALLLQAVWFLCFSCTDQFYLPSAAAL